MARRRWSAAPVAARPVTRRGDPGRGRRPEHCTRAWSAVVASEQLASLPLSHLPARPPPHRTPGSGLPGVLAARCGRTRPSPAAPWKASVSASPGAGVAIRRGRISSRSFSSGPIASYIRSVRQARPKDSGYTCERRLELRADRGDLRLRPFKRADFPRRLRSRDKRLSRAGLCSGRFLVSVEHVGRDPTAVADLDALALGPCPNFRRRVRATPWRPTAAARSPGWAGSAPRFDVLL